MEDDDVNGIPELPEGIIAFLQLNARFKYKQMDNGEKRHSIKLPGDVEVTYTIAGPTGGWQNGHYHGGPETRAGRSKDGVHEHYLVLTGFMVMAQIEFDRHDPSDQWLELKQFKEHGTVSIPPGLGHNVYLPADAVILTVKTGVPVGNPEKKGNDWWPDEVLDAQTKQFVTEADILHKAEFTSW